MRPATVRFRLWQIMVAIAGLAGLFAYFGVIGTVAVLLIAGMFLVPVVLARPGCRLGAAAWAASFYPLSPIVFLYATWFTAWIVLGHRPRSSLDDPKYISPIVLIPYIATYFSLISAPFGLYVSYPLMIAHIARSIWRDRIFPWKAAALALAPVLVWLAFLALLDLKAFGIREIGEWYMD